MKLKKAVMGVLAVSLLLSGASTIVKADANAKWNAAKGTAVVDGLKDDVYANAQEMKMEAVTDGESDGTKASAYAVYDDSAFYIFVEVADSALDDTSGNTYERDGVEFYLENKDQLTRAFAVSGEVDPEYVSESKVLKTDTGYNVELKVPFECKEGGSVLFALQINAASDGKRNCTLHTNADLANAWQDSSIYETLVFGGSSDASEVSSLPKTGEDNHLLIYGLGALVAGTVFVTVTFYKKKKIS